MSNNLVECFRTQHGAIVVKRSPCAEYNASSGTSELSGVIGWYVPLHQLLYIVHTGRC